MKKTIKYTYIIVIIDLIIAIVIAGGFEQLFHNILEPFVIISAISFLFFTYYIGTKIHYFICKKGYNFFVISVLGLYMIAVLGAWGGSTILFIDDFRNRLSSGFPSRLGELFMSYYVGTALAILVFGGIPILISGIILGAFIKYDVKKDSDD